ncbi:MAG TPA: N-6 DNA methylase [Marinagarivorans sp.]|nr:N-6 DNA methylase [Marinagarivorans sp.]
MRLLHNSGYLIFKNYGDTESELKAKIQKLFEKAQATWEGVFPENAKIELTPSHLAVCVSSLEKVKLFNSNLEVVDEAFEYLINKSSKGEKGQYFTPRYVIDMCVKMMNPQENETLIDTAAGSCGFPVHGIFHVWEQIRRDLKDPVDHLFTTQKKTGRYAKYVVDKVFGIDFDEKAVRVGRTLNLIAGDGQTNVLHLNTLDYERWFEKTGDNDNPGDRDWQDIYGDGWKRLRKLRAAKNENRDFQFDVLMANPPFAGDIKETRILARYDLARSVSFDKINNVDTTNPNIIDASKRNPTFPEALHASHEVIYQLGDGTYRKVKVKNQNKVGRDILFIERNLQFLKPGGRMAVVLPQGRFNNASDKALREYLAEYGRILAVVGLHGNVFKPHTGTKTSVLFIQKWNDEPDVGPLCPKVDDYPIFFATMQEPSKDNSGDKIYRAERHCMSTKQVTEIEKLQAKWRKIDLEEQKLRELEHNNKITAKQQARLNEITELRITSKDELEKVAINLDAPKLDNHGHLIVKHDLFNHDGLTGDGIAEAFCEFAKKEGLSFFR